jgi:hypothetical protein
MAMASPPKGGVPAYGSSRSTGGVFRGKALGNAMNIGDANEVWEEMDIFTEGLAQKPVKGKIHFYISSLNPPDVDITQSSFIANIHKRRSILANDILVPNVSSTNVLKTLNGTLGNGWVFEAAATKGTEARTIYSIVNDGRAVTV